MLSAIDIAAIGLVFLAVNVATLIVGILLVRRMLSGILSASLGGDAGGAPDPGGVAGEAPAASRAEWPSAVADVPPEQKQPTQQGQQPATGAELDLVDEGG